MKFPFVLNFLFAGKFSSTFTSTALKRVIFFWSYEGWAIWFWNFLILLRSHWYKTFVSLNRTIFIFSLKSSFNNDSIFTTCFLLVILGQNSKREMCHYHLTSSTFKCKTNRLKSCLVMNGIYTHQFAFEKL